MLVLYNCEILFVHLLGPNLLGPENEMIGRRGRNGRKEDPNLCLLGRSGRNGRREILSYVCLEE